MSSSPDPDISFNINNNDNDIPSPLAPNVSICHHTLPLVFQHVYLMFSVEQKILNSTFHTSRTVLSCRLGRTELRFLCCLRNFKEMLATFICHLWRLKGVRILFFLKGCQKGLVVINIRTCGCQSLRIGVEANVNLWLPVLMISTDGLCRH